MPARMVVLQILIPVLLPSTFAGTAEGGPREVQAVYVSRDRAPRIDGLLDDPIWRDVPATGNFRQRDPHEGELATEPTEVRILYDQDSIYFGIRCFDSHPGLIRATELRRDDALENDDTISILLDTFHDRRNANLFRTNPLGTQFDALIVEEGNDLDVGWDEIWWSETQIDQDGWTVEIMIPFKSLRSRNIPVQSWGLNVERIIRHKNELTYWTGYSRNWEFWNVSQAGDLTSLKEVRTGLRFRIKPYVLGGFSQIQTEQGTSLQNESQVGLEDVKILITPSITGDFTVNPDFAQTEVDEARVNLTRFRLFFPEKRQFFLEGAGIFRFGTPPTRFEDIIPELLVFHSRRIGLGLGGRAIPILAGGKVTGEHRGLQFAGLNAQTLADGPVPGANFTVLRVKQSIFPRSYIGGIFTNKYVPETGYYNRVGGLDANLVLFDKLTVSALASRSFTQGVRENEKGWMAVARWTDHRFDVDLEHSSFDENYNPEIGFVTRVGVVRDRVMLAWKPRPAVSWIRQLYLASGHQWFESYKGFLESRDNDTYGEISFESGDSVAVEFMHDYEFFDEPFQIHPDVFIPAGSYTFNSVYVAANAYPGRRFSGGGHVRAGGFYDGSIVSFSLTPLLKLTQNLSLEVGYGYNNVTLPTGEFTTQVVNSRFNVNLTNRWLTSTTVRYDNVTSGLLLNLRLHYIYRPGDGLFIVYNEGRNFASGNELVERALLVKLNHSFDF